MKRNLSRDSGIDKSIIDVSDIDSYFVEGER